MSEPMKWMLGIGCFAVLVLWSMLWFVGTQMSGDRNVRIQRIQAQVCAGQPDPGNCVRVANGFDPVKP